jgi:diphthine-ammonia ligase
MQSTHTHTHTLSSRSCNLSWSPFLVFSWPQLFPFQQRTSNSLNFILRIHGTLCVPSDPKTLFFPERVLVADPIGSMPPGASQDVNGVAFGESAELKKKLDNDKFEFLRGPHCFEETTTTTVKGKKRRAAISWTGGKDCHLALQRCVDAGIDVVCGAVFFAPGKEFNAHRLEWQQIQGKAIGIPIIQCPLMELETDPSHYQSAYAAAIRQLLKLFDEDIQYLVTGDIDYVGSSTDNYMQQVVFNYDCGGIQVLLPLWQQPRKSLLQEMLISHKFDIRLCCVKSPHFDSCWIGRQLNEETMDEMEIKTRHGLDLTGENGEYHTMVVDGPMYKAPLEFYDVTATELLDQRGQTSNERWWVISENAKLQPRQIKQI